MDTETNYYIAGLLAIIDTVYFVNGKIKVDS